MVVFAWSNVEAALYFVTEENAINSDNFVLDFDDTSTDFIGLDFGASLGSQIRYDILNTKFSMNRDLDLGGNEIMDMKVEQLAVAPACNPASAGRFYFNTTTDKTYVCDGSIFNMLENEGSVTVQFPAVQVRRTTNYTLTTTFTDITLDTTDLENSVTVLEHDPVNTDRILIKGGGLYQIIYSFTPGGSAGGTHEAFGQVMLNDATVLNGSSSMNKNYQGEYSTTSASFLTSLSAGDFISLQLSRDNTADTTQGDIFFSIVKIEGIKGDKGDPGTSGTMYPYVDVEAFTIDNDNNSADYIDIEFGQALTSRLRYEVVADKFVINRDLDLDGNELQNARIENLAVAPTCNAGASGRIYFNTTDNATYSCDGTNWKKLGDAQVNSTEQTTDYNVLEAGTVNVLSATSLNRPTDHQYIVKTLGSTDLRTQVATRTSGNNQRYYRFYQAASWSNWQEIKTKKYSGYSLKEVDQTDGTLSYLGRERDSDAKWLITKSETSGFTYAQIENNAGTPDYATAWANRLTLTYNTTFTP